MGHKENSVDGFVPRRHGESDALGEHHLPQPTKSSLQDTSKLVSHAEASTSGGLARTSYGLNRSDIDSSLNSIDEEAEQEHRRRRSDKSRAAKSRPPRRKLIKRIVIAVAILVVMFLLFTLAKGYIAGMTVFKGNLLGLIQQKELKMDKNGRSNILLLGTSEDDPGHEASYLTDSIMVMSIDQKNFNAYMVSVPRDLYVKYGQACISGYAGKINEYFNCVNDDYESDSAETERQTKTREFIGSIFGLDIQYSARVNYSVMRDVVNAVGNITVNIEGSGGAPGVMDSNFDWKCGASYAQRKKNCPPNGHFIDYPNGPAELDAEHALYLAQARGDAAPTYGLGRSNYDRELNQQKIIVAIKDKAMSAGTLTNPGRVSALFDALGKNLRTNIDTSEIRTLIDITQKMPSKDIQSVSLVDAEPALFTSQNIGGASSVVPAAGTYEYSNIQAYINKKINQTPVSREEAHVIVLNGSGVAGVAKTEADRLEKLGMQIDELGNAPGGDVTTTVIYQAPEAVKTKPRTTEKLEQIYGVKVTTVLPEGVAVTGETSFVIIVSTTHAASQTEAAGRNQQG